MAGHPNSLHAFKETRPGQIETLGTGLWVYLQLQLSRLRTMFGIDHRPHPYVKRVCAPLISQVRHVHTLCIRLVMLASCVPGNVPAPDTRTPASARASGKGGLGMDRWSAEQVEQFVLAELGGTHTVKALAQQFRANRVNGHDFRLLDAEMLSSFGANTLTRTAVLRLRQRYLDRNEDFAHPLPHMLVPAKPAPETKPAPRPRPLIDPNVRTERMGARSTRAGQECWNSGSCTEEGAAPCRWCAAGSTERSNKTSWFCCSAVREYREHPTDACSHFVYPRDQDHQHRCIENVPVIAARAKRVALRSARRVLRTKPPLPPSPAAAKFNDIFNARAGHECWYRGCKSEGKAPCDWCSTGSTAATATKNNKWFCCRARKRYQKDGTDGCGQVVFLPDQDIQHRCMERVDRFTPARAVAREQVLAQEIVRLREKLQAANVRIASTDNAQLVEFVQTQLHVKKGGTLIFTSASEGFLPALVNWVALLYRLELKNIFVHALDKPTHKFLGSRGFASYHNDSEAAPMPEGLNVDANLLDVWVERSFMVYRLLLLGYNVIQSDTDALWLQNPVCSNSAPWHPLSFLSTLHDSSSHLHTKPQKKNTHFHRETYTIIQLNKTMHCQAQTHARTRVRACAYAHTSCAVRRMLVLQTC